MIEIIIKDITHAHAISFENQGPFVGKTIPAPGQITLFDVVGFAQEKTGARHFCSLRIRVRGPEIILAAGDYVPQLADVSPLPHDQPLLPEGEVFEHFLQRVRLTFPQSFQQTRLRWIQDHYKVESLI